MKSNECGKPSQSLLLFLFLLVPASPTVAQQQQTPTPAPSDYQTPKKQDGPDGQSNGKEGDMKGKSKLEIETGTVNDRILEVMPNYGTVENADKLPPISSGQKFRLATAGVTDYFTF